MSELLLMTIMGEDKPGITSSIMSLLSDHHANILDMGQAIIQDTLSLGMLVEVVNQEDLSPIIKDVLFHIHKMGMTLRFKPVSLEEYERWVQGEGKPRFIITLLGRRITARQIGKVTKAISEAALNIEDIVRLSGRPPVTQTEKQTRACIELTVRGMPENLDELKGRFLTIAQEEDVDIAFQEDNVYRRNRRLVVFDMDSTLIQAEVIDELAKEMGVGDEVSAITEAAMRGELDFKESFSRRLALLKGLDADVLEKIRDRLPFTEGAQRLIKNLHAFGYKSAIVSGGFGYFGRHLQEVLGVDYVYANELEIEDGKITGRVSGEIVDGKRKAELLREIAAKEQISLEQVIAVGDGANDLPMLSIAGLGIAFHAKPMVRQSARQSISNLGLDGILYLIGVRDTDLIHQA